MKVTVESLRRTKQELEAQIGGINLASMEVRVTYTETSNELHMLCVHDIVIEQS